MKKIIIKGRISISDWSDALLIANDPLSDQLELSSDEQVTARWYISEELKDIDELKEERLMNISGALEARYQDVYSEITGYLWTTDECTIGDHDLIKIFSEHVSKYLYLEIDVHD